MTGEKVLVTGGNGHLGNTLVKTLVDNGYAVRTTVRNIDEIRKMGIFDGYDVEIFQADIRDEAAIRGAVKGVSGIFQVAALYHFDEQSLGEGIVENNVDGSQTVLRAAKSEGVKRLVFTSSIAAVGFDGTENAPLTEDNWSDPSDPYCRSKLESERAAWEFVQRHGLDLISLCPSIMLGPNFYKHTPSTTNVSAFINNQVPFRFAYQCSIVDVRDVAIAHMRAYENPEAAGRYLLPGSNIPDLIETLREFDEEMVLPDRVLSLEETRQFAEKAGSPPELVGQPFYYSDHKARQGLQWRPRPVAETLVDTIKWIKGRDL